MGTPSYMRSVVDRNIGIRHMTVLKSRQGQEICFFKTSRPVVGPTITLFNEHWGLFPCPRGGG
jgi:hypothetical protein